LNITTTNVTFDVYAIWSLQVPCPFLTTVLCLYSVHLIELA